MINRIDLFNDGFVSLEDWMGDDNTIIESARLSYLGKSKSEESDKALLSQLMTKEHTSPFEQVEFRFLVRAPIFVARQWMRHRTWNYSEVSRRYTGKDISFYVPEFGDENLRDSYMKSVTDAHLVYDKLVEAGVKREVARGVLPVSLYTNFYAKTDLRNLLHFFKLRRASDAQYEIRAYASAIEELTKPIVPLTMELWEKSLE